MLRSKPLPLYSVHCRRPPLPALPPARPAPPFWSSHPPSSSSSHPGTAHWHRAFTPASGRPPRLPLPLAAPPASPSFRPPSPLPAGHPAASQLGHGLTIPGGGDEPFRPYSQPDPRFASGYYPLLPSSSTPPVAAGGSQAPPHGLSSFDINNYFPFSSTHSVTSGAMTAPAHSYSEYDLNAAVFASSPSAPAAPGGIAGAAHGYSGYGVQSGYYQLPHHSGVRPIADPARHYTSSPAGWQAGPYASLPPIPRPAVPTSYGAYGEGSSRSARVDMPLVPPSWHPAAMGDGPASFAVPGCPRTRSQYRRQASSPVPDVCSNDNSMASDGGDDDLSLASSRGDNAGIIGNAAGVQHDEGNGDSLGSEEEGTSSEGDSIWPSGGNSSSDVDEVFKEWENLFGKEDPVLKCMKSVMESTRKTTNFLTPSV